MSKTIYVLLATGITLEYGDVQAGEVVELPELSAKALINEGKAEEVTPDENTADALKKREGQEPQEPPLPDPAEEVEKIRKALDDQYKLEDLKPAAQEAGVDFAYDVTKKSLIAAIIEQGKAQALLK